MSKHEDTTRFSDAFNSHPDIHEWSVDLDDCDRILRVVSKGIELEEIIEMLNSSGFSAEDLKE